MGRAGRFGTKGLAITFVSSQEDSDVLNAVQGRFEVNISELPQKIEVSAYSKSSPLPQICYLRLSSTQWLPEPLKQDHGSAARLTRCLTCHVSESPQPRVVMLWRTLLLVILDNLENKDRGILKSSIASRASIHPPAVICKGYHLHAIEKNKIRLATIAPYTPIILHLDQS